MRSVTERGLVATANAKVPIATAFALAGGTGQPGTGKLYCPFGAVSHADGGDEPAFRLYDGSAFCFACWEHFTPVRLCAQAWDVLPEAAAERLLAHIGWQPEHYSVTFERAAAPEPPDRGQLAKALKARCERAFPGWEALQYETEVAICLAAAFSLLTLVKDDESARLWLEQCYGAVEAVMGRRADAEQGCPAGAGRLGAAVPCPQDHEPVPPGHVLPG